MGSARVHEHEWLELNVMEQGQWLAVETFCPECGLTAEDLLDSSRAAPTATPQMRDAEDPAGWWDPTVIKPPAYAWSDLVSRPRLKRSPLDRLEGDYCEWDCE